MGLTGVIYAIIVVGWAVFLVPLALRRHDQAARNRSIERFSSAMRVLARRGGEDGRIVVTPPRQVDPLLAPTLARDEPGDSAVPQARATRAAMRAAAARRRRVLVVLVAITIGVAAGSALGYLQWWAFGIPLVVIGLFLWMARRQVRLADERFWQEAADSRPEPSNVVRRSAARVDATHGTARADLADDPTRHGAYDDVDEDEPTVTLTAEQVALAAAALHESHVEVVALKTVDGTSLWDPLPVTLPTYVDKPAAQRTYRTIELGEPGTWSAGHSAADSEVAADAAASAGASQAGETDTPRAANA